MIAAQADFFLLLKYLLAKLRHSSSEYFLFLFLNVPGYGKKEIFLKVLKGSLIFLLCVSERDPAVLP